MTNSIEGAVRTTVREFLGREEAALPRIQALRPEVYEDLSWVKSTTTIDGRSRTELLLMDFHEVFVPVWRELFTEWGGS